MTAQRKNLVPALLLSLLASGLLGGCAGVLQEYNPWTFGEWRQIHERPINHVEMVSMEHVVAFRPNAIRLDQAELGRMIQFLTNSSVKSTDEIAIHAPAAASGTDGQVARARLDFLQREFVVRGLATRVFRSHAGIPLSDTNQVAVVVHRAIAMPPDCTASDPILAGRPSWTPGCTTNASLGLMVADPRDLVRGRPISPADGVAASKAIEGYRDPAKFEQKPQTITIEATN